MGGQVRKSAYRQPPTPGGLQAMEEGRLTWLDDNMYNNLNTGVLEQYLEEKNLSEGFEISHWDTKKVLIGVAIGAIFSGVTAYIGLKIGLAISAAWYIAYLLGMALKWTPSEVNISTSATTGATHASTGFIFTFPAIFLLAQTGDSAAYLVGGEPLITNPNVWDLAFIGIIASMFAGFLGVMYFIIFRRVWLVEDPLPMPGFEAYLKLLDITCDVNTGAAERARDSLRTVGLWTLIGMGAMFVIEYPLIWANERRLALADFIAELLHAGNFGLASLYSHAELHQPTGITSEGISFGTTLTPVGGTWNPFAHTHIGLGLSPSPWVIGWFMRLRVALLVNLGTVVAWFILVPMAVAFDVAVFDNNVVDYVKLSTYSTLSIEQMRDPANAALISSHKLQMKAHAKVVKQVAIGAIVGGGLFGLLKMAPTFKTIFADIAKAFGGEESEEWVDGKGWYEWPLVQIPVFMGITAIAMIVIFTLGGFPIVASALFTLVLLFTTFLLGAIAVRVMGETGIEPVSGTSFIVLIMLMAIFLGFNEALGLSQQQAILLGLVGTTVFGSAISMSGTVVADYKNSLYIGNRPYHISKGNIFGVVPGAVLGAGVAIFLSYLLANGTIDLLAPQANAFASFTIILAEGQGDLWLLGLGIALGVFAEWATGMGTSFGLGMYLPTTFTLPMIFGGGARDWWEEKRLKPRVDEAGGDEKLRALLLLGTFMIAAGLLTGEALFGTLSAVFSFVDTLSFTTSLGSSWQFIRLFAFLGTIVVLGGIIYALFKSAGILDSPDDDGVLDAIIDDTV
ncbi:MAG: hypothetical protein CMB77_03415 [Euryarchaeota archaeon]|nr:hypothetical protein [Euryarchaeota archaeon]